MLGVSNSTNFEDCLKSLPVPSEDEHQRTAGSYPDSAGGCSEQCQSDPIGTALDSVGTELLTTPAWLWLWAPRWRHIGSASG